jgi:hypothetical protein
MSENASLPDEVKLLAAEMATTARAHEDSRETLRSIDQRLKEFQKAQKQQKSRAVSAE